MKKIYISILMVVLYGACDTQNEDKSKPFEQRKWRLIYSSSSNYLSRMMDQNGNTLIDSLQIYDYKRSWSPNGKKIAYYSFGGLETSILRMFDIEAKISKDIALCGDNSLDPLWNAKSDKLIAEYGFGYKKIVDTSGTHMGNPSQIEFPIEIDTVFQGDTLNLVMYEVCWNAKGDGVLITEYTHGEWRLYEVGFPDGKVRSLIARCDNIYNTSIFDSPRFEISPDGQWIKWNVNKNFKSYVYLMHIDKTTAIEIGQGSARWSNDSEYLVYFPGKSPYGSYPGKGAIAYHVPSGQQYDLLDSTTGVNDAMMYFDDMKE